MASSYVSTAQKELIMTIFLRQVFRSSVWALERCFMLGWDVNGVGMSDVNGLHDNGVHDTAQDEQAGDRVQSTSNDHTATSGHGLSAFVVFLFTAFDSPIIPVWLRYMIQPRMSKQVHDTAQHDQANDGLQSTSNDYTATSAQGPSYTQPPHQAYDANTQGTTHAASTQLPHYAYDTKTYKPSTATSDGSLPHGRAPLAQPAPPFPRGKPPTVRRTTSPVTVTGPPPPPRRSAAPPPKLYKAPLEAGEEGMNHQRLGAMLSTTGEYPAKYRLLIWDFLLRLPHNGDAFKSLASKPLHPSYAKIVDKFPLLNKSVASKLAHTLSHLAHWCPVFAEAGFIPGIVFPSVKLIATASGPEAGFIPGIVFPFVKLFATASGGAGASAGGGPETLFELLATILINWTRGWFERFPHPPLGVLVRLQDMLMFHDSQLALHMKAILRTGFGSLAWEQLSAFMTEALTKTNWLRLCDHIFTEGPDFLYFFVVAYFMSMRDQLMSLDTEHRLHSFLSGPPPVNMKGLLQDSHKLRKATPEELKPASTTFDPLPEAVAYSDFKDYPEAQLELFMQDRKRIEDAEEALARRRKVVSELEVRSKAVAMQAASLNSERQQIMALQAERREQLRNVEIAMAAETTRLDDKAKAEKLKQVGLVEAAYQSNLASMRQEWHAELASLKTDVQHKKEMMAMQLQAKEEDEGIKALEFHARQRMWALEQENIKSAAQAKLRDEVYSKQAGLAAKQRNKMREWEAEEEVYSKQAELAAKQRNKMREWEAEEETRRLKGEHEMSRRTRLATLAEEGAAQQAARREVLVAQLSVEDDLNKADAERRLRTLAEDQASATANLLDLEGERMESRAKMEEMTLKILAAERASLKSSEQRTRQRLADTEAKVRLFTGQAALLERRRAMERQSLAEETEAGRLVEAIMAEKQRDAQLELELAMREEEAKARLEFARRVGNLQQAAEVADAARGAGGGGEREGGSGGGLLATRTALQERQEREMMVVRELHEEAMHKMAVDREQQEAMHKMAVDREQQLSKLELAFENLNRGEEEKGGHQELSKLELALKTLNRGEEEKTRRKEVEAQLEHLKQEEEARNAKETYALEKMQHMAFHGGMSKYMATPLSSSDGTYTSTTTTATTTADSTPAAVRPQLSSYQQVGRAASTAAAKAAALASAAHKVAAAGGSYYGAIGTGAGAAVTAMATAVDRTQDRYSPTSSFAPGHTSTRVLRDPSTAVQEGALPTGGLPSTSAYDQLSDTDLMRVLRQSMGSSSSDSIDSSNLMARVQERIMAGTPGSESQLSGSPWSAAHSPTVPTTGYNSTLLQSILDRAGTQQTLTGVHGDSPSSFLSLPSTMDTSPAPQRPEAVPKRTAPDRALASVVESTGHALVIGGQAASYSSTPMPYAASHSTATTANASVPTSSGQSSLGTATGSSHSFSTFTAASGSSGRPAPGGSIRNVTYSDQRSTPSSGQAGMTTSPGSDSLVGGQTGMTASPGSDSLVGGQTGMTASPGSDSLVGGSSAGLMNAPTSRLGRSSYGAHDGEESPAAAASEMPPRPSSPGSAALAALNWAATSGVPPRPSSPASSAMAALSEVSGLLVQW
eukprot:gene22282-29358_t